MPEEDPNNKGAEPVAATRGNWPVYTISELTRELRQSEIISNLSQFSYDGSDGTFAELTHPYAIVLTQDCDLLWDYEAKQKSEAPELNGVLLYELEPTPDSRNRISGSDIWKRIKQNKDDRYHVLEAVPPDLDLLGKGMPDLVIDFKKFFTLPADEIYRQIAMSAQRRCRLEMPYREHLQSRAAYYLQRVTLPLPIQIAEVVKQKAIAAPDKEKKA